MASEKDLELLDQYVGNRLNPEEKASFEKKLDSDVSLKNEYLLQQRIVGGIRQARTAELKKLLNDIPLSSIPTEGPSLLAKASVWVIVAGLIGTGLYFYFDKDKIAPKPQVPLTEELTEEKTPEAEDSPVVEPQEQTTVTTTPEVTTSAKDDTPAKPKTKAAEKEEEKPVAPSTLDVFDPAEEGQANEKADTDGGKTKSASAPSIIVETQIDKKYNFHYQFKDNKLYLYGSFEKNLYEIMEFFSDNKRTMFLFYKDNYYLLNEENEKVRALSPIHDAVLLQKLKDYRGK